MVDYFSYLLHVLDIIVVLIRLFLLQSNLGDSNIDFSKTPDFSNLNVSPDLFCYHLM